MVEYRPSYVLYRGRIEWDLNEFRDCLEIVKTGRNNFVKLSPVLEFEVCPTDKSKVCAINWHIIIVGSNCSITSVGSNCSRTSVGSNCSTTSNAFKVYVSLASKGCGVDGTIGIKGSLTVSCENKDTIENRVSYKDLSINSAYNRGNFFDWSFPIESIPHASSVKLVCNLVAYDLNSESVPPTSTTQLSISPTVKRVDDDCMRQYDEELTQLLNKDRLEGTNTDTVLVIGKTEYKVHKFVLAVRSDFFKTRFSDRWDMKDGAVHTVDMNDTDLTGDIIEPLLCGVYTGKVESQEMALKLLPVTDKYQFKKLKAICESVISSQLNKQNVLEIYVLAKQCDARDLMAKCEILVNL